MEGVEGAMILHATMVRKHWEMNHDTAVPCYLTRICLKLTWLKHILDLDQPVVTLDTANCLLLIDNLVFCET